MIRKTLLAAAVLLLPTLLHAEAKMLRHPTYSKGKVAFTYLGDMDDMMKPGVKVKVRQNVKILNNDSHVMDWYETRGGKEIKTMEIAYTRQK